MTIYAAFDNQGLPQGFFPTDVFPDVVVYDDPPAPTEGEEHPVRPVLSTERNPAIPPEAIEVSADVWNECLANQGLRRWDGSKLVLFDPPMPAPTVPNSASRLGLMRALREIGKWDAAKAAIASSPDVQEEWDLAIEIKRSDPLTGGIVQALDLTSADVDKLLTRAAALTA